MLTDPSQFWMAYTAEEVSEDEQDALQAEAEQEMYWDGLLEFVSGRSLPPDPAPRTPAERAKQVAMEYTFQEFGPAGEWWCSCKSYEHRGECKHCQALQLIHQVTEEAREAMEPHPAVRSAQVPRPAVLVAEGRRDW